MKILQQALLASYSSYSFLVKFAFTDPEPAELMSLPFKNCYNLTDRESTALGLAGGITAAVCAVISFTALVILALVNCYHHRVCETVIKRLVVGLIASSVLIQLVLALELVHYFQPEQVNFCKADGFFTTYFAGVQLLFALAISLVLFLTVCGATTSWKCHYKSATFTCCGWKINKLETLLFVSVFCFPLLFDWIPFTTDSYGPSGPFCYIHWLENNCSIHEAGFLQMILLWEAPFVSLGPLILGLFIISLCLLGYVIRNSKAKKLNKVISDSIFSLALLLALYLFLIAVYFYPWKTRQFAYWMVAAISTPISSFLLGLDLLVAIHFPLSSMITCCGCNCHGHTHSDTESDQATIRASTVIHKPSYTTWNPPHSTNTDSQAVPLGSDEQPQEYGSMA